MTNPDTCPKLFICPQAVGGKCPHAENCVKPEWDGWKWWDDQIPGLETADWGHLDDADEPDFGEARRRARADREAEGRQ